MAQMVFQAILSGLLGFRGPSAGCSDACKDHTGSVRSRL